MQGLQPLLSVKWEVAREQEGGTRADFHLERGLKGKGGGPSRNTVGDEVAQARG